MSITGLRVRFDMDRWVRLPFEPADPDAWATSYARELWELSKRTPTDDEVTTVASYLLASLQISEDMSSDLAYAWFPDLDKPPGPVAALLLGPPTEGTREELEEFFADEELIEPPRVEPFETPLGTALRYRRYGRMAGSTAVALRVTYLWSLHQDDTSLLLHAASPNLGLMATVEPHLDAMARVVEVTRD